MGYHFYHSIALFYDDFSHLFAAWISHHCCCECHRRYPYWQCGVHPSTTRKTTGQAAAKQRPDPIKPEIVREFVGVAHGKFDRTKEMLAEMPSLLNATWDWGGGDFEMGIGGAGHMGNREIAEFLISKGARMDIFVAAMLGKLDIVRAMITAYPDLKNARGPHGISLLVHAQKGGADAAAVVDYFQSLGLK